MKPDPRTVGRAQEAVILVGLATIRGPLRSNDAC